MSDRNRGDYHFHSSREERLASREEPVRETGSIFRRNRSLLIILLDIVVVLIMFGLYLLFFQPEPGVEVGPYTIEGTGFSFDDAVYLTVTIEIEPKQEAVSGGESLVEVEFPDGVTLTDVLPSSPEFATVIRHVLPEADVEIESGEDIIIDVRLRGQSAEIPVTISQ